MVLNLNHSINRLLYLTLTKLTWFQIHTSFKLSSMPVSKNIKKSLSKRMEITYDICYLTCSLYFLPLRKVFGIKMGAYPLLSSTCLTAACFDHKSQVSSFKASWVFKGNVLSNNLNTGSLTGDKWKSGTNKSSSLTISKIKGSREEERTPQPQFSILLQLQNS